MPAQFGKVSTRVFFDTGAGLDVLAPSLIHQLGGKAAGHFTGFRMGGERLDIDLYAIPELRVGPLVKHHAVVASWDALDSPQFRSFGVRGIVSMNDFRRQPVTFDFTHKTIVFETADSLAARRTSGTSVRLQFDDERGISLDSFARFLIDSQPGECEIDMGSPSATISTRYLQPLGIKVDAPGVHKRVSENIAGATIVRYDTTLSQISLAAAPAIGIDKAHVAFSDIIYDCVIGVDFWRGRSVTFDIAQRTLVVSPE